MAKARVKQTKKKLKRINSRLFGAQVLNFLYGSRA